ncbi:MAG TPA: hypothetical protein VMF30_07465, partial [Pirellulales bacterium]|nr:hypothetical protein [Pirellulales bacterium]
RPSRLLLNIDQVSDDAPLEVSLVDDAEQPLPGFEPVRVAQPGLRVPVVFAEPNVPAGKRFRVRIRWPEGEANPRFYALYFLAN